MGIGLTKASFFYSPDAQINQPDTLITSRFVVLRVLIYPGPKGGTPFLLPPAYIVYALENGRTVSENLAYRLLGE